MHMKNRLANVSSSIEHESVLITEAFTLGYGRRCIE
jgi:hypothetical protein